MIHIVTERISLLQLTMLVALSRITFALIYYPEARDPTLKQDIWISSLLGALLSLVLAWLLSRLWVRFSTLSLGQVLERVLGRPAGKAVTALYALFLLLGTAVNLRLTGEFVLYGFLPRTPLVVISGVTAVLVMWAARSGLEVMARAAQVALPLIVGGTLVICLLVAKDVRLSALQPVLVQSGLQVHLKQAWSLAARNTEWVWIGLLMPCLEKPHRIYRAVAAAHLFQGVMWLLMGGVLAGLLGPLTVQHIFPFYSISRLISVADFLERLDAIIFSSWLLGMYLRIGLFLWGAAQNASQVLGLKDYRPLVLPMGAIALTYSIIQADSFPELMAYNSEQTNTPLLLLFCVLIPLAVLGIAMLRKVGTAKGGAR